MYFWKYILAKKAGLSQQKCNMALYGLPVLPIAEAFEKTVTGNPISVSDALAQDALSLQVTFEPTQDGTPSIDSEPTTEPYLSKLIPRGNKEYYSLVGGTVAWNQLVDSNTTEVPTISGRKYLTVISGTKSIITGDGTSIAVTGGTDNVHDLTQMFANNPAIADYAYSLEQSEAGSGIAWLKSYGFFTKDYYPYNAGELISVNTSGHKIGSTTYPIDNIDLRGLFKLSNGKLYCEGDTYPPSGGMERKFEYRAYQSGDESLTDAITDGTHTVVKRATPTTESLTAYTSPIDVEAGGTEEFVDNRTVPIPVGNETYYASEYEVKGKTSVTVSHSATSSDTPTEYEVEFTSQGTVYGGTVDIVSGVLTVVNKHFTYNSIEYYGTYGSENAPLYYCSIPNYATEPVKRHPSVFSEGLLLSNIFAPISTEYLVNMKNYEIRISDAALPTRFYMRVDGQNPVSASNPLEIVAELQTPQTYQLTTQQVQMLLGDNYLETEDGTITITYMAGK